MMKDKHMDPEDDGRVIADMSDLDRPHPLFGGLPRPANPQKSSGPFSKQDRRAYTLAALASALCIGAVYLAGLALIIWLITLLA